MKNKIITLIITILITCISICLIFYNNKKLKDSQKKIEKERYVEIRESVDKAVLWNISAQYPNCSISKEYKETDFAGTFYNSNFLIKNGYIEKEELLDVDNKSYCDVFVKIDPYYENPLDHQNNCKVYYKIYLKCKNYKDKGYEDWGL